MVCVQKQYSRFKNPQYCQVDYVKKLFSGLIQEWLLRRIIELVIPQDATPDEELCLLEMR
jgi:hypothetical protein